MERFYIKTESSSKRGKTLTRASHPRPVFFKSTPYSMFNFKKIFLERFPCFCRARRILRDLLCQAISRIPMGVRVKIEKPIVRFIISSSILGELHQVSRFEQQH